MRGWLKLIGSYDFVVPDNLGFERPDLLKILRFGEAHPPTPIGRGDHLVFHAVGHQRIVAAVVVLDDEAELDPAPKEWEKRWPLMLRVNALVKVRKVAHAPPTAALGPLPDLAQPSFLPLTPPQLESATQLITKASSR